MFSNITLILAKTMCCRTNFGAYCMNGGKKMDVSMSLEVSQVLVASLEAFLIKSILKLLPEQFYLYIFKFYKNSSDLHFPFPL